MSNIPTYLHGSDDVHNAASGIFDTLPDDPFGEGDEEAPDSGDPASAEEPEVADEDDLDSEGAEAPDDAEGEDEESDEPDEEGAVEDDESEEDEEEEEDEAEEDDEESLISVKIDGEVQEITLDELKAGYSRTASFTRKSQKLAEERKAFDAEMEAIREERERYGGLLDNLQQQLMAQAPQEPTGDDPREWAKWQRAQLDMRRVEEEQARVRQLQMEDANRRRAEYLAAQDAQLVEIYPEWAEREVAQSEKARLAKYALSLGFPQEEVDGIIDHRVVMLLQKAAAYDEQEEARKKVKSKAKKAPVLEPGKAKNRSPRSKKQKKARSQREQLRKTGTIHDAAGYLFETLTD